MFSSKNSNLSSPSSQWKGDSEREQGPRGHELMSDENGTCTGIVVAYPLSFPGISTLWCESCTIKRSVESLWKRGHEVLD
ncbi:hypothetical protein SLA2020_414980 [Shorea laevis]